MKQSKSRIACCVIAAAVSCSALLRASAQQTASSIYWDPSRVKQLIEQTMQQPQNQNPTAVFYGTGISHIDGYIPYLSKLSETHDPNKPYMKYTYYDGRISTAENFDASGQVIECYAVWNNSMGAPVLGAYRNKAGVYDWYAYAEFDASGKIQTLYRFGSNFELGSYQVFSYQDGNKVSIKEYSRDAKLLSERVQGESRRREICSLVKYGLKPVYPSY
jgi:hypothetical protein